MIVLSPNQHRPPKRFGQSVMLKVWATVQRVHGLHTSLTFKILQSNLYFPHPWNHKFIPNHLMIWWLFHPFISIQSFAGLISLPRSWHLPWVGKWLDFSTEHWPLKMGQAVSLGMVCPSVPVAYPWPQFFLVKSPKIPCFSLVKGWCIRDRSALRSPYPRVVVRQRAWAWSLIRRRYPLHRATGRWDMEFGRVFVAAKHL